jgi:protein-S-isoprenylcysteine O-methyltransferase Ste14
MDKCAQIVFWIVGIAEIATIVAHELSPSDVSSRIQSTFMVNGGSPQVLQLTSISVGGMLFIALGTLLRMWCYRTLKNLFTFEVSIRKDHRLVTTGPYSVVRHPSYSGMLAAYIGMVYWYGTQGSWLRESGVLDTVGGKIFFGTFIVYMLGVLAALLGRGTVEDRALRKTFGKQWDEWARRVPYLFMPWIY